MSKKTIEKNVQASHEASKSSRYMQTGLTDQRAKLSSKNFDKLMAERGLSKDDITSLKASNQSGSSMEVRHAKAGEKFVTTHGTERSSGVFVSEKSLGNTPSERIDRGALPYSNSAEYETTVELARDQNLVYGKIAPQTKFSKMDPAQVPRSGGAEQVITDGGYNSGAVTNRDPKYPAPASYDFQKRAQEYKNSHTAKKTADDRKSSYIKSNSNGQSM
jgi:hypothetical protein